MSSQTAYPSASAITYTLTILLATYVHHLAITPPNPLTTKTSTTDSVFNRTGGFTGLFYYRWGLTTLFLYHALVALFYHTTLGPSICPSPSGPNPALLNWSPQSATYLALIIIFGLLRLGVYRTLGSSFTFTLTTPKEGLVTSGVYRWVQHPSYTTYFMSFVGMMLLFWRVDGPAACWVEPSVGLRRLNVVVVAGNAILWVLAFRIRVRDEESFLKREFGKEWEVWHGRTARFVPFVW